MTAKQGKFKILEQFAADGMTLMFGNPGTVEQGLLDALDQTPGFRYVLTLQETVAAGIADGYARAAGGPALVQLHSGVGLGNAVGMLYQSMRGHTPLVVIAGEAGVRYEAMDAQMAADLVAMARPVTKHATRVTSSQSLLRVLRRAVKIAMTPPRGPVFVSLPMDVLDELNDEPVVPASIPLTATAPSAGTVAGAAELLAGAERPLVLVGDGVGLSGAQAELVRVAELLGADVWAVDSSEVNMPASHPLARGQLGHMFGEHSAAVTGVADAVLIVGTYVFPEVFPALDSPFRPDAKIVHIDLNAYEIAKNFPVDLGLVADPKATLAMLGAALAERLTPADLKAASVRRAVRETEAGRRRAQVARADVTGSTLRAFLKELAAAAPDDLVVFDEALTASPAIADYFPADRPGSYFLTRGGSLGVGIPGAIGAKLAHPGRTVVGFTGDGGAMYTYQALWTAARYDVGAKFVVCNNGKYKLLDDNIEQYWRERDIPPHAFPSSFDLSHPRIRFAELARGLGVEGIRVEKPEQAAEGVRRMLASPGPFVVDLSTLP
ncbi:benzoylformate decarboxylase [Planobispora rosea]|uniref:Benzoylformate decarboxylase n=1 Tax=Planobispora rosea TaxID=35762 RepID=A0A8J3WFZ0_PLARO|nr:thiamine pyrophosphate-binding protein [Planobispora rosea]GGS93488.1 benzoylformate decarboxylase [Planobispora rosea]GIH87272.1 benzoylformate decarboxylase [Planobispora rosea]